MYELQCLEQTVHGCLAEAAENPFLHLMPFNLAMSKTFEGFWSPKKDLKVAIF